MIVIWTDRYKFDVLFSVPSLAREEERKWMKRMKTRKCDRNGKIRHKTNTH